MKQMSPIFLAARTLPFKADPDKTHAELTNIAHELTAAAEQKKRWMFMLSSKVPGDRSPARVYADSPWTDHDMRKIFKRMAAVNQTVIFEVYHLISLDGDYTLRQYVHHASGQSSHELTTNPGAYDDIKLSDEVYLQQLANWYQWNKPEGIDIQLPSQVVICALSQRWHTLSKIVHPAIEHIAPFQFDHE